VSVPPQYVEAFQQATSQYPNVSPGVLWGLIQQESGWGRNMGPSSAGAVGIAQFLPATAASLGIDPHNPQQSIIGAARYLSQLIGQYGSVQNGLAAYNGGAGAVAALQRGQPYSETRQYLAAVNGYAAQYSGGSGTSSPVGSSGSTGGGLGGAGANPVLGCLPGAAGGAAALLGAFWLLGGCR
jgi:soluble lytic murein transglycosylase-like protein